MKRNNFWRWVLVVFLVAWAINEIYPPVGRPLLKVFIDQASDKDAAFTNIVTRAEALQKQFPERVYGNLFEAVGTNDLTRYFPSYVKAEDDDPTRAILNRIQQKASGRIKLGLDLRGGTSFLVDVDMSKLSAGQDKQAVLEQAVEVLRRRVDKMGVAEPIIQPVGANSINISLPGLTDAENESARKTIEKAAFLEFRMVHPDSDEYIKQGIPAPGYEVMKLRPKKGSTEPPQYYLVKIKPERGLTGKDIKFATVARHPISNEPEIHFTMTDEGGKKFGEVTTEYQPQGRKYYQLGIVLDGELISAPRINDKILGGSGTISGNFTVQEAIELSTALENPLQAPVKIKEERRVDPSLGSDSIRSGLMASAIGTTAVVVFMLVYYLFAGVVANLALMLNIVILFGVMCYVGTTLTIPGIAGIVLTIGMAVDANVLIYERIREELTAGKSLRGALAAGYDKAFGTIFDSNLTTLISSVILIYMGTGPVKGFGVTLTIGLLVSMFTALVVSRLIFDWVLERNLIKALPMLHMIRNENIDFMRIAKVLFISTWVFICFAVSYGLYKGKDTLGVDFRGGDTVNIAFSQAQKVGVDKVRDAITRAGIKEALIQYQKDLVNARETLRLTVPFETGSKAFETLQKDFPQSKFERLSLDKVGPSVGKEILKTAIVAVLLSLFGILIYVAMRYEFSFAVGAVLGLVHDVLLTLGCYVLSGRQFNAPMVAAILTIIGFSINDTIVIFDRIREDLKLGVRGTFREIMNKALNQTLSRTIITSGTVFLATMSLYLFGGNVIDEFAFTFLVGIITGTYSSIYICSALVLWWHKGERPSLGSTTQMTVETNP
jgi:SecD/SecF fusion protein